MNILKTIGLSAILSASLLAATVSTYTNTAQPDPDPLTLKQGQTIEVGFFVPNPQDSAWTNAQNYYDSVSGFSTTVMSSGTLDTQDLSTIDMLFVYLPQDTFTAAETASFQAFLDAGGRIFFVGEHEGYAPVPNAVITTVITALGGSMSILGGSYSDDELLSSEYNLNNSYITSGITTFEPDYHAQLEIEDTISQAVMVDDNNRIVVADQALSKGRVTLIADEDWLDDIQTVSNQNGYFLTNMAIDSDNNQQTVTDGGNPNEGGFETEPDPTYTQNVIWHTNTSGEMKTMDVSTELVAGAYSGLESQSNTNLKPVGMGDFTGDGVDDILAHNPKTGKLVVWDISTPGSMVSTTITESSNTNVMIAGAGDFDGDGDADIAILNNAGTFKIWEMEGTTMVDNILVSTGAHPDITPVAVGDLDNDGVPDVILQNKVQNWVKVWTMNSDLTRKSSQKITVDTDPELDIKYIADMDNDGKNDILAHNPYKGYFKVWLMDGLSKLSSTKVYTEVNLDSSVVGTKSVTPQALEEN